MVVFTLLAKCNLEGIQLLYPCSDFTWTIKVKCTGCGEESPSWHAIDSDSSTGVQKGRGSFNFVYKCKFCSRENTLDIIESSVKKLSAEGCRDFKSIVSFDCRGLQPTEFNPAKGWIAEAAESTTHFSEVDLTEKEWVEYDEKSQESVGVYEFQSKFIPDKLNNK